MSCLARRLAVAHAAMWDEPLPQTPPVSSCASRPLNILAPGALTVGMRLHNATPEVVFQKQVLPRLPSEPKLLMLDVGAHVSGTFAFKGFWRDARSPPRQSLPSLPCAGACGLPPVPEPVPAAYARVVRWRAPPQGSLSSRTRPAPTQSAPMASAWGDTSRASEWSRCRLFDWMTRCPKVRRA